MPRKTSKIIPNHDTQMKVWTAMSDADIPMGKKRVFTLTIKLHGRRFRHEFTCIADSAMSALNKYFWQVRNSDLRIMRVERIQMIDVEEDSEVGITNLEHIYPF